MTSRVLYSLSYLVLVAAILMACRQTPEVVSYHGVIPKVNKVEEHVHNAPFVLRRGTTIRYTQGLPQLEHTAQLLAEYVTQATGLVCALQASAEGAVAYKAIVLDTGLQHSHPEAYRIEVDSACIHIQGASEAGVFYGVQTLRKAMLLAQPSVRMVFPAATIEDFPRFAYRGVMLDVARHFAPVDDIKQLIDILALHHVNRLHWHLTDDQGWRIEIQAYPELTRKGANRNQTVVGRNTGEYDGIPHGGYYTRSQVQEIVAYAAAQHISIIPEIDLPGHMRAALAAYPHLGCTGGPYEVAAEWGVFDDVLCVGQESTFEFIEQVLTEVMQLFPSEYIHIGGDECPRVRWTACPHCQQRMQALKLAKHSRHGAEELLQGYCVERVARFLAVHGRRAVAWDEVLDTGIDTSVMIMAWRGVNQGAEAAQRGHRVVMTPDSYLYFNYYQSIYTQDEPLTIGGFVDMERVYGFEPVPAALLGCQVEHIQGVQANIWTEYITSQEQLQYMLLPRLAALAEIQWTQPGERNYTDFAARSIVMLGVYNRLGYNYARHILAPTFTCSVDTLHKAVMVSLHIPDQARIHYTLDGSMPTVRHGLPYTTPFAVDSTCAIQACAIRADTLSGQLMTQSLEFSLATLCTVQLRSAPHQQYTYQGAAVLVDGVRGGQAFNSGHWLGFYRTGLDAVVDLGSSQLVSEVEVGVLVNPNAYIIPPQAYQVSVSLDNQEYTKVYSRQYPMLAGMHDTAATVCKARFAMQHARYIHIKAQPHAVLPKWHPGADTPPFLFVDEIMIR